MIEEPCGHNRRQTWSRLALRQSLMHILQPWPKLKGLVGFDGRGRPKLSKRKGHAQGQAAEGVAR
jgi:hypothetical protein